MKGLRKVLTPFAPDQSGAVSVLYALGGMVVIVDAGGCAGNICGFDEPRWQEQEVGAIFSAGLRDMDAILGRDDLLVRKLVSASGRIRCSFIALVGTPVPAVIGTDLPALARMVEKKTGLPSFAVSCNGLRTYDYGLEETYATLLKRFAEKVPEMELKERELSRPGGANAVCETRGESELPPHSRRAVGVIGLTPLDFFDAAEVRRLTSALRAEGFEEILLYGYEGGLEAIRRSASVSLNLVLSPAGVKAAQYMEKTYGIPYEIRWPVSLGRETLERLARISLEKAEKGQNLRILAVHQQTVADSWRAEIEREIPGAEVTTASWFMMNASEKRPGDRALREEEDFSSLVSSGDFGAILADPLLRELVPGYQGVWIDEGHFAVSGQRVRAGYRKALS